MQWNVKSLIADLGQDAARYAGLGGWQTNRGFWVSANYRFGKWARPLPVPLRWPLLAPQKVLDRAFRALMNVRISAHAQIAPGLCLIHPWNVMIGPAEIGENCMIFHEVTIGSNANTPHSFPTIGKNVNVFAGARVLGAIRVGDDANIGANCVVTSGVPPGASVVTGANRIVSAAAVAAFGVRKSATKP